MSGGLLRAKADLEGGDVRRARERLKSLVVTYPDNVEVRSLLALAYRRDGQVPEAGRWGYLVGTAATERERRAFEAHAAYGYNRRIKRGRLRHLLRTEDLMAIADDEGRARLAVLRFQRRDGQLWLQRQGQAVWTTMARPLTLLGRRR